MHRFALPAALLAAALAGAPLTNTANAAPASQSIQSRERQVDALFAQWRQPGRPGAAVAVIRDGKVLLNKGYGLADLEHGVKVTPETAFTIGSMSKQFTAFAIQLLAQDGRLSLDDDIRRYVPEVPDFGGATITLRHLLHHTSGLRDHFDLLMLTGWRGGDVVTQDDVLALVARQRALNFAPGAEFLYSNTGYVLLALVVERVTGKPLATFAQERIFAPLGMKHTRFLHGYGSLVPQRALAYVPAADGGYQYIAFHDSADGAGGVVSTTGDLALWDRNFYDGRVGGKDLVARMQATPVLTDGKPINYASGLFIDGYRGRPRVQHSGSAGGFQAQMWRLPEQRFTVVVLANTADLDIWKTTSAITDLYLGGELGAPDAPAPPAREFREIAVDPARLDALAGYYALSPASGVLFTREGNRLIAQATGLPRGPVFAYGEREFFTRAMDAQFTFEAPGKDGIVAGGVLHLNGQDIPARRTARPVPPAEALNKFAGLFYSDELGVAYTVAARDGSLVLAHPRGTLDLGFHPAGEFTTLSDIGNIRYTCGAPDACNGFTVTTGRVRNLQFTRVAPVTAPAAR